jgi:alkyldihydroxyacetonephosphate synthase
MTTSTGGRLRSWWGWGYEDSALGAEDAGALAATVQARLGVSLPEAVTPPAPEAIGLPPPRISPPARLASRFDSSARERARHAHGRSYRDVTRNLRGAIAHPPDLVALPGDESDVVAIVEWASSKRAAVIPYGGGSSVVGGVESDVGEGFDAVISLDLTWLDRVLDVDATSAAARIQGGALGPHIEAQLRPHRLTLRHQPQSFEFSTLGGWIATRSAGHFATLRTRIDDAVESLRVVTPSGIVETRRLPSSGAGPDPNRLFLGSEGAFGVIVDAWVRVHRTPVHRSAATVAFPTFAAGLEAVRAIAQSDLHPANCRLLDPLEALLNNAGDGSSSPLLLAFESADHPVDASLERALELARDHGGAAAAKQGDAAGTWRAGFVRAPYIRDALIRHGMIVETFESAITWDRLSGLLESVHTGAMNALSGLPARGLITCRITHAYPDGAAPYWTVIAFGDPGAQLAQWDAVKAAVSDVIAASGATITHHHAVGRDHRPWYERERPELFAAALRAAKRTLDPAGILNPGVLIAAD